MQLVWEGSSHHIAAIKQINTAVTKVLAISDFCIIWVAEQAVSTNFISFMFLSYSSELCQIFVAIYLCQFW